MVATFSAMASPCEVLLDSEDTALIANLAEQAAHEAWRIEQKFSRYREDGIVPRINTAKGIPLEVDAETAELLDFAFQCHDLSDGMFDITSGVLRRAWKFDGSGNVPQASEIDGLLPLVGLDKTIWKAPFFSLPEGMEIDFGGIGKEYAVDRVARLLSEETDAALLINFGGDVAANKGRRNNQSWRIGVESIGTEEADQMIQFRQGGVATSGDSKRFLLKDGKRYGHILNPQTGWPIADAPRSVTVLASNCVEAGVFSTLAMMCGKDAESFLEDEGVSYRVQR